MLSRRWPVKPKKGHASAEQIASLKLHIKIAWRQRWSQFAWVFDEVDKHRGSFISLSIRRMIDHPQESEISWTDCLDLVDADIVFVVRKDEVLAVAHAFSVPEKLDSDPPWWSRACSRDSRISASSQKRRHSTFVHDRRDVRCIRRGAARRKKS